MPTPIAERIAHRAAAGIRCDAPGCRLYADRIGRYCDAHQKRDERHGHPTAAPIKAAEMRPFVECCRAFIAEQRAHPGVAAALQWIGETIRSGRPVAPWRVHRKTPAGDRVSGWLAQLAADEVSPEEILATICAVYLLREWAPRRFPRCPRDRFFRHQTALRVLRLARGRWLFNEKAQRGTVWRARVTAGTREALGETLVRTLGPLALNAARHLVRRMAAPAAGLPGQHAPFLQPAS